MKQLMACVSARKPMPTAVAMVAALAATAFFFLLMAPSSAFASDDATFVVKVDSSYLALRSAPAYDASNEIGKLYTGDVVDVIDATSNADYWKVKSSKYKDSGWVNKDYLVYPGDPRLGEYTVKVDKNYLALRSAPAYDASNEIGKLYTGDVIAVIDKDNDQYWFVYSSKLDKCGYVNKDYLREASHSYGDYKVKVDKNYLALRSAPAYDASNEIGKLYTGDVVTVQEKRGQYWWVYAPTLGKEGYVNSDYLVAQ